MGAPINSFTVTHGECMTHAKDPFIARQPLPGYPFFCLQSDTKPEGYRDFRRAFMPWYPIGYRQGTSRVRRSQKQVTGG